MNIKNSDEVIEACSTLGISARLLPKEHSTQIIAGVLEKFNVQRPGGHLGIKTNSISVSINDHEYSYSDHLPDEMVYMFFDQGSSLNSGEVVEIENGRVVGRIVENCFGMEYFLTNSKQTFLIAVNWYVVEGAGAAIEWLKKLKGET